MDITSYNTGLPLIQPYHQPRLTLPPGRCQIRPAGHVQETTSKPGGEVRGKTIRGRAPDSSRDY
jgi:hypothetical protein